MADSTYNGMPESRARRAGSPAKTSPRRMLAFVFLTVALAVVLIALQNDAASLAVPVFVVLVLGACSVALASAPPDVRRFVLTPGLAAQTLYRPVASRFQTLAAYVAQYRLLLSRVSALSAALFMCASTYNFQLMRVQHLPLDQAVAWMLAGAVVLGLSLVLARPNVALPVLTQRRARLALDVNTWITGLGIAVLLLLAEVNGKVAGVERLYPITTDTQFVLLMLGVSLLVMGLAGWQPLLRLPPVKWRALFLGVALLVGASLALEMIRLLLVWMAPNPALAPTLSWSLRIDTLQSAAQLPAISLSTSILDAILFWTLRLGTVLTLWAFIPVKWTLPRPSWNWRTAILAAVLITAMALLSQSDVRTSLSTSIESVAPTVIWLTFIAWGAALWWFWHSRLRPVLLGLAGLAVLYILASISGTFVVDIGFWLATSFHFWLFMAAANLLRIPLAALYRRLTSEPSSLEQFSLSPSHGPPGTDLSPQPLVLSPLFSRLIHYAVLVFIVGVAFFARFYLLNDTMRFLIDEDSYLTAVQTVQLHSNTPLLLPFSSIAAFPYIFPYMESKTIEWFGANFIGLRGASAIVGALTVIALYALARVLFDRKTALVAALLLATFPPHVQFSRIGINEMTGPFLATLSFVFLARALLHNRRVDYALGGAFLGLTHYFDEGSRLLFTPVALAWVVGMLVVGRRGADRKGLWITVITALLVAFPIYYTLVGADRPLAGRMVENNSGLSGTYWRNLFASGNFQPHIRAHVLPAFFVYTAYLDQTLFYMGDSAMLLWFVLPVSLLGFGYLLWRWRAPGPALVILWIVSVSMGNSLLTSSMSYPRFVLAFPALMLATAAGLCYVVPLILRRTRLITAVIVLVAIGLAAGQLYFYFHDHLPLYNTQFRAKNATPDGYDAALRSVNFPDGTYVHIISQNRVNQIEAAGLLRFIRDRVSLDTLTPDEFTNTYLDDIRCRVDHAFFIERTDFKTLDLLREHFYLRPPQVTPYDDLLPSQRLILFYAPYIRGSEDVYGREC